MVDPTHQIVFPGELQACSPSLTVLLLRQPSVCDHSVTCALISNHGNRDGKRRFEHDESVFCDHGVDLRFHSPS